MHYQIITLYCMRMIVFCLALVLRKCRKMLNKTSLISKKKAETVFMMGNTTLDQVTHYRYLGIIMDNELRFQ